MFAPIGYTPLSILWDQFVESRIDAIYHSASEAYRSKKFVAPLVRGSPVDIAEYVFTNLMWKCRLYVASSNGKVLQVHTRCQDGVPGLFTQIAPYRAAYDAACAELDQGNRDELEAVAGMTFEEWNFAPEEREEWDRRYPELPDAEDRLSDHKMGTLRFHTLPICFERERFMIVEALPSWAKTVIGNRDQVVLVERFAGWALCVPDAALVGWDKILQGETPILDGQEASTADGSRQIGRPQKVPRAVVAYRTIYPDGHTCSWKEAIGLVSREMGENISVQTLRRAVAEINDTDGSE